MGSGRRVDGEGVTIIIIIIIIIIMIIIICNSRLSSQMIRPSVWNYE